MKTKKPAPKDLLLLTYSMPQDTKSGSETWGYIVSPFWCALPHLCLVSEHRTKGEQCTPPTSLCTIRGVIHMLQVPCVLAGDGSGCNCLYASRGEFDNPIMDWCVAEKSFQSISLFFPRVFFYVDELSCGHGLGPRVYRTWEGFGAVWTGMNDFGTTSVPLTNYSFLISLKFGYGLYWKSLVCK